MSTFRESRWPVFDRVVGGELPLDPALLSLWGDDGDGSDEKQLIRRHAGCDGAGLWLKSGRAALGVALDLLGASARRGVAIPTYQCTAVVDKVAARGPWATYPLSADFVPDLATLRNLSMGVVLTTVYFGSRRHMDQLTEMARGLWELPGKPWIIEDRVQCLPEPCPPAAGRDFVIYSLRKHYPVPDGAMLIAVSDRAREAFARRPHFSVDPAAREVAARAVFAKLAAKAARWRWCHAAPIVDDPDGNGLADCVSSEHALDAVAFDRACDGIPASAGSARLMLGRDPALDMEHTMALIGQLAAACRENLSSLALPVADAGALGLPILVEQRSALRARAAASGLFLPVHWPRDARIPPAGAAERWYAEEVTLPLNPSHTAADVAALAALLKPER